MERTKTQRATATLWYGWASLLLSLTPVTSLAAEQFGLFEYEISDGVITITDYPEDATGDVVIPSEIQGLPVTAVGSNAFFRCASIDSVSIPSSITSLGQIAFGSCEKLVDVFVPASVISLGEGAFTNCKSLLSATFQPGSKIVAAGTFSRCNKLDSVSLPVSIESIGIQAFQDCSSLRSISIPSGVPLIRPRTFERCGSLEEIFLPASVQIIEEFAFASCTALATITFAEDSALDGIERNAFSGCPLTGLTLPAQVRTIGLRAFAGCSALTSLDFSVSSKLTTIGPSAFERCPSLANVTLPSRLERIENGAFFDCGSLSQLTFHGDAPALESSDFLGITVFSGTHPDLVITRTFGSSGFDIADWENYTFLTVREEPIIDSILAAGSVLEIRLAPAFVHGIGVEYSPSMSADSWTQLGNFFEGAEGRMIFVDPDIQRTGLRAGYYRAFQRLPTSP